MGAKRRIWHMDVPEKIKQIILDSKPNTDYTKK